MAKECSVCNCVLRDGEIACPYCGGPPTKDEPSKDEPFLWELFAPCPICGQESVGCGPCYTCGWRT